MIATDIHEVIVPKEKNKQAQVVEIVLTGKPEQLEQFISEIRSLLKNDDATIIKIDDDGFVRKLRPTKTGQVNNKGDNINIINSLLADDRFISKAKNFLEKRGFEEDFLKDKRIYRRKTDLPDPTKPHWAEVNRATPRSKKDVKLRLEPNILELVNKAAQDHGQDRQSWMTLAFLRAAQDQGLEMTPELEALLSDLESGPS